VEAAQDKARGELRAKRAAEAAQDEVKDEEEARKLRQRAIQAEMENLQEKFDALRRKHGEHMDYTGNIKRLPQARLARSHSPTPKRGSTGDGGSGELEDLTAAE
jgi:hypothetical protein